MIEKVIISYCRNCDEKETMLLRRFKACAQVESALLKHGHSKTRPTAAQCKKMAEALGIPGKEEDVEWLVRYDGKLVSAEEFVLNWLKPPEENETSRTDT